MKSATEMLAMLAGKQTTKAETARADNRAWVAANIPECAALFDALRDHVSKDGNPPFAPRMVMLERIGQYKTRPLTDSQRECLEGQ